MSTNTVGSAMALVVGILMVAAACRAEQQTAAGDAASNRHNGVVTQATADTTVEAAWSEEGRERQRPKPIPPSLEHGEPRIERNILLAAPQMLDTPRAQLVAKAPVVRLYKDAKHRITVARPRTDIDTYAILIYRRVAKPAANCQVHECWEYIGEVPDSGSLKAIAEQPLTVTGDIIVMSWVRHMSGPPRPDILVEDFSFASGVRIKID